MARKDNTPESYDMSKRRKFDPKKHCGAKTSRGPCTKGKGFNTNHYGAGRCSFHGGGKKGNKDRRIKHGLYIGKNDLFGPYLPTNIKEAVSHIRKTKTDLMNLVPHLEVLNGLLMDLMKRQSDTKDDIQKWHDAYGATIKMIVESGDPAVVAGAVAKLKESARVPLSNSATDPIVKLIRETSMLVEKIHRKEQTTTLTVETVSAYAERLLLVVFKHVKDKDTLNALVADFRKCGESLGASYEPGGGPAGV